MLKIKNESNPKLRVTAEGYLISQSRFSINFLHVGEVINDKSCI